MFGRNKLHKMIVALNLDHVDMVGKLLSEGVDPNAFIRIEGAPATLLVLANRIESSRLLLEAGSKLNATFLPESHFRTQERPLYVTALWCASYGEGNHFLVQYLLAASALAISTNAEALSFEQDLSVTIAVGILYLIQTEVTTFFH